MAVATVATVAAFSVATVGCSGNDRLTPRAYRREASAICRRAARRAEAGSRLASRAAAQRAAADDLAGLRPPEPLARFDAIWVALERQSAAEFEALVAATRAGDRAGVAHRSDAVATLTARAAELALAEGITACPVYQPAGTAAP